MDGSKMTVFAVDSAALAGNIEVVKAKAGVPVIGVVKANGYGLGLVELASALKAHGIDFFAITELQDIDPLRAAVGEESRILMLRSTALEEEAEQIASSKCIASVGSTAALHALEQAAEKLGVKAEAHVKIDVGLSRYGFLPSQIDEIAQCYGSPNVDVKGIYTHFPSAFAYWDKQKTLSQIAAFEEVLAALQERSINPGIRHVANSPALFNFDQVAFDAVRVGSAFTGRIISEGDCGLEKIGSLEARVIDVKDLPQGSGVGYNSPVTLKRATRAAIVPIGTNDGFGVTTEKVSDLRSVLSAGKRFMKKSGLTVEIEGKSYPVIGEVDLSLCMVDVTGSDVSAGDLATVDINPLFANPRLDRDYR